MILGRLATGAGQAGIFPAATGSIARWFPGHKRAVASGYLTAFMSLGAAAANWLGGWVLGQDIRWPWLFLLPGVLGLVWAALFYFWYRDQPQEHPAISPAELAIIQGDSPAPKVSERTERRGVPWLLLARSRAMWLIACQQFFRAAGYALFLSWFPKYLGKVYGATVEEAGILTSIALIGVVIGSAVGGIVSDWMLRRTGSRRGSRKGLSAVTMLLCAACFWGSAYASTATQAIALIAPAAFFGSIAGPAVYALTIDMGDRHVGTVFSVMNMAGNIGAAVFSGRSRLADR